MKLLAAITVLCSLFLTAFSAAKDAPPIPAHPDSLQSVYLYTEAVKRLHIDGDSVGARNLLLEVIRLDSAYAPAYYQIASNGLAASPDQGVEMARKAYQLDSANNWYLRFYGQALLYAEKYREALDVYRRLRTDNSQDPDNYRILALLYDQQDEPFAALTVLDSAEVRFGRTTPLSALKRRLLIDTHQLDKAAEEALAMVQTAPYEAEHRTALAELYGMQGKDSLARAQFERAMQIDSTDIGLLLTQADFFARRQDSRSLLQITRRLFALDEVPLDTKIRRFEQLTSDTRFYRENYFLLNDLASMLAIRYPKDSGVVKLYARHLIASGELEEALSLYKLHLNDLPAVEEYFRSVIDIESYLQRPDSVNHYVDRALKIFPEKVDFHIAKANVLSISKHFPQALKAYKESLRYASADSLRSAIWGLIGDTWHQKAEAASKDKKGGIAAYNRSEMKQCFNAYDRSLRYDKDNIGVLNNYAYFLSEQGRELEKALAMSSRVVALTDNNPTYLDTHAWVLFQLGRPAEAKKFMQQAIALDGSNSPELLIHYGDILYALGERFLAEIYWRKALENGYDAAQVERRIAESKIPKP